MNQETASAARPTQRYQPPSNYVDDGFYGWLNEVSLDLNAPAAQRGRRPGAALAAEIERLLTVESRLLDQHAYAEWLGLYVPECAYWIPASNPAGDPRARITLEFHDRRRLLDRVARLGTGLAYSQLPASRTARLLSGLEIWASPGCGGEWRARCNFLLAESRAGRNRVLAGWYGFVVRKVGDDLRLVLKQVNLLDPDEPQGNNSFFL